ncbi:hypothetical protein ACOMHN_051724 [Nucella lapillus]
MKSAQIVNAKQHTTDRVSLENDTDDLLPQLAGLSAQTAALGGQVQTLTDLFIPATDAQNAQQDDLIDSYGDQIKEKRHRLGQAVSCAAGTLDLTMSTKRDTAELKVNLTSSKDMDNSQTADIDRLHQEA